MGQLGGAIGSSLWVGWGIVSCGIYKTQEITKKNSKPFYPRDTNTGTKPPLSEIPPDRRWKKEDKKKESRKSKRRNPIDVLLVIRLFLFLSLSRRHTVDLPWSLSGYFVHNTKTVALIDLYDRLADL